jgi:hypothetical protein
MDESRDTQELGGKRIDHFKLCKDYLCGECGARLVLKHFPEEPHWRTVCSKDQSHDPQQFFSRARAERQRIESILVYDSLPPEFKKIIGG